jgi:hypothetical protein
MKKGGGTEKFGLLEYEKSHNVFLRALQSDSSLRKLVASLSPDLHVLIVPQNISIEHMAVGLDFAQAHVRLLVQCLQTKEQRCAV